MRVGVAGPIVPLSCSLLTPPLPPRLNGTDPDDSSPSAGSCKLDIAALLQRRLVKMQTRFASAFSIEILCSTHTCVHTGPAHTIKHPSDKHKLTVIAGDLFCCSPCDSSSVKNKLVAQSTAAFNFCFILLQMLLQTVIQDNKWPKGLSQQSHSGDSDSVLVTQRMNVANIRLRCQ